MKTKIQHIILIMWGMVLATGCNSETEQPEVSAIPMLINATTETRADSDGSTSTETPVFLFWRASDMIGNHYNVAPISPYCVSKPSGAIDNYKETPWDTGYKYPENNLSVLATGYFPQTLTISGNYATLTIPEPGKTDVMVARTMIEGSSLSPYTYKEDNSLSLQFIHAQTRIDFKAIRHLTMKKRVRNVHITMHEEYLPYQLTWIPDEKESRYTVSSSNPTQRYKIEGAAEQLSAQTSGSDKNAQSSPIGFIYIKPLQAEMKITVRAEMSNYDNFTPLAEVTTEVTIPLDNIPKETGSTETALLQAGDSYEITLVFQEDKIELTGRKLPWEEGGNILIPLYPLPDNQQTGTT